VIQLALVVAAGSLTSGLVLALLLRRAPTVWAQLAGLALIAVCVPLVAVLLSGWVMFHMGADVKILAVAAGSATAAVFAALAVARSITGSLRRVGTASQALSAGELSARAPVGGAREISELAVAFNAMAGSLERLFDARRELVAWASHDLRAPIASLQAMLEAIEDGLASAEDYLPTLREQVRTLSMLVDDLFELARIDAGVLTLELRPTLVAPLVDSALRLLRPEADARGVALSAEVDERAEAPLASDKIERVLFNLLTNALRHTPTDGSVAVRLERQSTDLLLRVEDDGDVLDRDRVAVLDSHVRRVEELEVEVVDADRGERAPECLGAEVEEPLVARACVDVDRTLTAERVRVAARHPHGVPREPALPDVLAQHPGRRVERKVDRGVLVRRVAGRHRVRVDERIVGRLRERRP
jgi:signal transduction histidine kinase